MFEKFNANTANPSNLYVCSLFGIENATSSLVNFYIRFFTNSIYASFYIY